MSLRLLQASAATAQANGAGGGTWTTPWPQPTVAGSLLIAAMAIDPGEGLTTPAGWTQASNGGNSKVYFKLNSVAGEPDFAINTNPIAAAGTLTVMEFAGVAVQQGTQHSGVAAGLFETLFTLPAGWLFFSHVRAFALAGHALTWNPPTAGGGTLAVTEIANAPIGVGGGTGSDCAWGIVGGTGTDRIVFNPLSGGGFPGYQTTSVAFAPDPVVVVAARQKRVMVAPPPQVAGFSRPDALVAPTSPLIPQVVRLRAIQKPVLRAHPPSTRQDDVGQGTARGPVPFSKPGVLAAARKTPAPSKIVRAIQKRPLQPLPPKSVQEQVGQGTARGPVPFSKPGVLAAARKTPAPSKSIQALQKRPLKGQQPQSITVAVGLVKGTGLRRLPGLLAANPPTPPPSTSTRAIQKRPLTGQQPQSIETPGPGGLRTGYARRPGARVAPTSPPQTPPTARRVIQKRALLLSRLRSRSNSGAPRVSYRLPLIGVG